ncbi:MAG: hypothetical protein B6244_11465 [Candidatus Cloacimonetes bacterium 4572_55]|nr:MAG: hypothetical protein B6244_11465 [Candidatus Cloacimonetes bacterium 4572_55]
MNHSHQKYYLFFLLIPIARLFFGLADIEVQPWDESLYAVRAKSALYFGDWLDQSTHAIQGLYSAAHPPLFIWLTSLSMKLFGINDLTVRIWSAIAGALTIFLVYLTPQRRSEGLFAAFTLSGIGFFSTFSRMGQLDIFYTFFIMLGLYFWRQFERTEHTRGISLVGVAFGLAMMSKIIVGLFLPMAIAGYILTLIFWKQISWQLALRQWLAIFVIGCLIAAPWHLFMWVRHGREFIDYYLLFHIYQRALFGVESNVPRLGRLFFVNQLPVMMSLSLVAAFIPISKLFKTKDRYTLLYLWAFLVPFVIFSISATKLRTYAIPMLPPLALLSGRGFRYLWREKRVHPALIAAMSILSIWGSSQEMRNFVRNWRKDMSLFAFFIIAASSLLLFYLFSIKRPGKTPSGRTVVAVALIYLSILTGVPSTIHYSSGLPKIAEQFYQERCLDLVAIDTTAFPSPQISYYFNGIDLGWDQSYRFNYIRPDSLTDSLWVEQTLGGFRNPNYVIVNNLHSDDSFHPIIKWLEQRSDILLKNKYYLIYRYSPR